MIRYRVERQYGRERRFILDRVQAEAYKVLTGRVTLREADIAALEDLGLAVAEEAQSGTT